MGLDIFHEKLVMPDEKGEDFDVCEEDILIELSDMPREMFLPYLFETVVEFHNTVAMLFTSMEDANAFNDEIYDDIIPIVEQNVQNHQTVIESLFRNKGLDINKLKVFETNINETYYAKDIQVLIPKKVKYAYVHQCGYQRKKMNADFSEKFDQWPFAVHKFEDFQFAYQCVMNDSWYNQHYTESEIVEIRAKFKRDFIDNYEYGRSLMSYSW